MPKKVDMFDDLYYTEINEARWSMAEGVLDRLGTVRDCFDVGCGPGWFSERLVARGLRVWGLDGRSELVDEARSRVPEGEFSVVDITNLGGEFDDRPGDLVFCFGLLYHLENPFAAIRNLFRLTKQFLFIETQVAPGLSNDLVLVSEGRNHTQGLNYHALIPSRNALIKMLYVSGFESVYRFTGTIQHADFIDSDSRLHRREIFLVTKDGEFTGGDFVYEPDPKTPKIDYSI